ncbi:MAG: adenylate kinase [Nocardioidaceae bacterium]|nr:adenylate kinase [Nocardioidaceae bacterium]
MRLVLVGPPGAGKGTQAKFLAYHFKIPHISTGDIFRANVAVKSSLGVKAKNFMDAGDLVPDAVTIAMVRDRLAHHNAKRGYLLDGFPRTVPQAEALTNTVTDLGTQLDAVLELRLDDEEVVRRLSGRRTCHGCGRVWHTELDKPEVEGICDACGGELFQRDDDEPETVRRRLEVYREQTAPLVDYYADAHLLRTIDAYGSVDSVTARGIDALEQAAAT